MTDVAPQQTIITSWRGDKRFAVVRPGAPETIDDGDRIEGPGPVETLLGALAACSALEVVAYLAKRRTPASALDVAIESTRRIEAPRRVMSLRLIFHVTGERIDAAHTTRAINLAITSYCSVASTLASDLAIESQLVLNGVEQPVERHVVTAVEI